MTDLEKVEELTKALQDGKTLVNNYPKIVKLKIINGFICKIFKDGSIGVNATFYTDSDWQIQEPEPPFEITPNQLAEYECTNGDTVLCYGKKNCNDEYTILHPYGHHTVKSDGKTGNKEYDLIRKIRDIK